MFEIFIYLNDSLDFRSTALPTSLFPRQHPLANRGLESNKYQEYIIYVVCPDELMTWMSSNIEILIGLVYGYELFNLVGQQKLPNADQHMR